MGLGRRGKKKWRRDVADAVGRLIAALEPEDTVIGGGNVHKLKGLPPHCRAGDNENALRGGFRLWEKDAAVRKELLRKYQFEPERVTEVANNCSAKPTVEAFGGSA